MPVSGRELATLDFANLIGGPLNAIIEAQAKSAITTANFIKEVAFDENKDVINVNFEYTKKNQNGNDQKFVLTVPFLTMLPVPYITVDSAVVEFNAKITSVNHSEVSTDFKTEVGTNTKARYWFASARLKTKTSYQRQTSASERAERTFDMHVRVEASNEDMPAGTERLLELLEEGIGETKGTFTSATIRLVAFHKDDDGTEDKTKIVVDPSPIGKLIGKSFDTNTISAVDPDNSEIELAAALSDDSLIGQTRTIEIPPPAAP